jgi:hypothetical protein
LTFSKNDLSAYILIKNDSQFMVSTSATDQTVTSWSTHMARIFISGSSAGLGLMAGELLVEQGHQVVLHARNAARGKDARRAARQ